TSWRHSSRPAPGPCATRWRSIPGPVAGRRRRGRYERAPANRADGARRGAGRRRLDHLPAGRVPRRRRLPGPAGRPQPRRRGALAAAGGRLMRHVVVLDYGSGNLRSAERALARAGASVAVTADLRAAEAADGLV